MNHIGRQTKRILIGIAGGFVFAVGLVLIPYPGPGWLIVFAGLAILATEFAFAARALEYSRNKYDTWTALLKRQPRWVQALALAVTGMIVVATVWLFNGFGIIVNLFDIDAEWLVSPFFR